MQILVAIIYTRFRLIWIIVVITLFRLAPNMFLNTFLVLIKIQTESCDYFYVYGLCEVHKLCSYELLMFSVKIYKLKIVNKNIPASIYSVFGHDSPKKQICCNM